MEIKGVIIAVLPLQEGQGKNGPWYKQEYILETETQYPKKICFSLWNDKIDEYNLFAGLKVTAKIDIESREYNSRWYTEIKAYKVEKEIAPVNQQKPPASKPQEHPRQPTVFDQEGPEDDLPF